MGESGLFMAKNIFYLKAAVNYNHFCNISSILFINNFILYAFLHSL